MQNLFSKYKITKGLRMYPTDDGNNKKYGKDPKFFVSSNTSISEGAYTLVGKWYSYALLNMYGETVKSVFVRIIIRLESLSILLRLSILQFVDI